MKIVNLLFILNQLRMFHWQTKSFAQHEAFGKTYDSLEGLIDTFVEVYIGKYGRVYSLSNSYNMEVYDYSNEKIIEFINKSKTFLTKDLLPDNEFSPQDNTDLLNIRDEMLAAINKLNYLLTLK